ncbi:MAG: spore germination protein [Eubacteriales bacterium]|nr:spore germination protein [Eubacteriales bacterium]
MANHISNSLYDNMEYFHSALKISKSFDIIYRMLPVGGRNACIYFIDGFVKDDIMEKLLEFFYSLTPEDLPETSQDLSQNYIPYVEVDMLEEKEEIVTNILSGVVCLLIDGYEKCFAIDCRTYPMRSVEEPGKDKTLRGSRDGFVETVVFNTALIRRRIRDPQLVMEMLNAGESSKTDIVLCYMQDRADEKLLDNLREKITSLKVDALTMSQESLAEAIYRRKWYNPFPKFKYTERPDTTAASILDGKIAILVDNAPTAILLPATIFDILEEADDYYFPPITGTYLRLSRFIIALMSLVLTPIWLLFMQNTSWIPEWLSFIKVAGELHVPILVQLLILEFAIDGLKLAAVNTPQTLSTPLSVIAGIVVGEFAVKSGWFNAETMLYMAFVAIANYTQSNFELGYALKFMRIILLLLVGLFNFWGLAAGILITFCFMLFNRTISGESYLYPLIPFNASRLAKRLFRKRAE